MRQAIKRFRVVSKRAAEAPSLSIRFRSFLSWLVNNAVYLTLFEMRTDISTVFYENNH